MCRANLFQVDEDLEILKKVEQDGCISMGYSTESTEPEILQAMNENIAVEHFSRLNMTKMTGNEFETHVLEGFKRCLK